MSLAILTHPPSTLSCDACVIGAGIVGVAIACELASRGMSVVIVDPNQPGSGATAAGMGHVLVMDDSPVLLELTGYARTLWANLADSLPPAADYARPGTVWIAANPQEMLLATHKAERLAKAGIEHTLLDSHQLQEAEPKLRGGLAGGLLVQDDAVVLASVVASHLLEESKGQISFVRGARALAIQQPSTTKNASSRPVMVMLDQGSWVEARYAINAAGTAAPELMPGIPIRKRKGHLILSRTGPLPCRHELVELGYLKSAHGADSESVAFNIQPRGLNQAQNATASFLGARVPTGQILLGASRQYGSDSLDVEPHIIAKLLERAEVYMPGISAMSVERTWAGFRAATPDGLPLIGRYEEAPDGLGTYQDLQGGIYLASGHEGLGITTSLATAQLLADMLTGHAPKINPAPYDPMRFQRAMPSEKGTLAGHGSED